MKPNHLGRHGDKPNVFDVLTTESLRCGSNVGVSVSAEGSVCTLLARGSHHGRIGGVQRSISGTALLVVEVAV